MAFRSGNDRGGFSGGDRGFGRDRDNRGGGGRFGGGRSFERRPVTMHAATCAQCGAQCEVPFRPSGDKPVYCNNCFKRDEGAGRSVSSAGSTAQFDQINAKLDKILRVLQELEIDEGVMPAEDLTEDLEPETEDDDDSEPAVAH